MLSKQLEQKLEVYEQIFFGMDKPVPFMKGLYIYPVKVKDYYTFYSSIPCLTMDKSTMKVKEIDEKTGAEVVVSRPNIQGIRQSYMAYLIDQMQNEEYGRALTNQVISILELSLHIKNGFYCPHCHSEELTYEQMLQDIMEMEKDESLSEEDKQQMRREYFIQNSVCPKCGGQRKDIIGIVDDGKGTSISKRLYVYDNVLLPQDLDELIAIILHYNILNYDGDKNINPKLKEALDQRALMENKNYHAPSLEKQLVCISISSPYTMEELQEVTLRKLTMLLKVVDSKVTYSAQLQGMFSGMVTFKEDPPHWIFSDDKQDMSKKLMTMSDVREKFKHA